MNEMATVASFKTLDEYLGVLRQCFSNIENESLKAGQLLREIRDSGIYRERYGTFEELCNVEFKTKRRHAYRLIDFAEVVGNVSNWTQTAPATESQARPLTRLPPEQRGPVWEAAHREATEQGRKVTARDCFSSVLYKPKQTIVD